jgi:hypothetical protein
MHEIFRGHELFPLRKVVCSGNFEAKLKSIGPFKVMTFELLAGNWPDPFCYKSSHFLLLLHSSFLYAPDEELENALVEESAAKPPLLNQAPRFTHRSRT